MKAVWKEPPKGALTVYAVLGLPSVPSPGQVGPSPDRK